MTEPTEATDSAVATAATTGTTTTTGPDQVSHLRASMELRRQAEEELSQAAEARRAALDHADQTIANAEAAAEAVRREAERSAAIATAEAHRRADELVAAARVEANRITDRAETAAKRLTEGGVQVLDRLEGLAQLLRTRMEEVGKDVGGLLISIEDLRKDSGDAADRQPS